MKSGRLLFLCVVLALVTGCGGGGGGGSSSSSAPTGSSTPALTLPNGPTLPPVVGNNVLTVTVDGSECSPATLAQWPNKPCVSVTICDPANTYCQTVNDILLDTGDYGLRIFQQTLPAGLLTALSQNQVQVGSLPVYECIEYGDGSAVWGPVQRANVVLTASEQALNVPIHLIGSSAGNPSQVCAGNPTFSSPAAALYNGSLGLGFFVQDCGPVCASSNNNRVYYTCSGTSCTGAAVPLASQVQNPVAHLPVDKNGICLMFPSVPSGGTPLVSGYLVLGIGTQSNNGPSGVVAYGADQNGNFTTVFNNITYPAFLDSGSNGFFFPDSQVQTCDGGWFCPPSTLTLSATTTASAGSPSAVVQFQIANFNTLINSSNNVFSNIGASQPGLFDWGLPFFLGRNVYIGLEGTASGLGAGPYWAY